MSSTRCAAPGGEFAAEKFASSAEFERGLLGSMIARRCTVLEDPKDKELIWAIHYFSHWGAGLKALATTLLETYPEHLGTAEMVKLAKHEGQNYSADQVKTIRQQLPAELQKQFPLRGEFRRFHNQAMHALRLINLRESGNEDEWREAVEAEKNKADKQPNYYPVDKFLNICRQSAGDDLENAIRRLCLDPHPDSFAPWYFAGLKDALRSFFMQWTTERTEGLVITAIGREVIEALDYTAYSRQITLLEGESRTGKSTAAKNWCELRPGSTRFIEVPPGNDDTSFFRALARGLGIGNFAQYKATEIRERVESVLLTGDVLLVLDEAWRLWPQQSDPRFGFPKRITWIMTMADQGVPICLISTPQFLHAMKSKQEQGWNSAQLQGRITYKRLPDSLSMEDLTAVAAALLPEADDDTLRAMADYARSSAKYLGAIKTIALRAQYFAHLAKRDAANAQDVRRAMKEIIPSDSNLVLALKSKPARSRRRVEPVCESGRNAETVQPAGRTVATDALIAGNRRQEFEEIKPLTNSKT